MQKERFFSVSITENWIETLLDYETGKDHKEIAERLPLNCKRVFNERFREIETTGKYYRITEECKGGKGMIFEIFN